MKQKGLLIAVFCLLIAGPVAADDDVMITRDGSMMTMKVEKISSSQVTFTDLKHKKRGRLNAPADFVYMIMKEKGSNIFFDEEGNQTTSPAVKFDKMPTPATPSATAVASDGASSMKIECEG